MTTTTCAESDCTGTLEDGYCDVCGSPTGGNPAPGAQTIAAPSWGEAATITAAGEVTGVMTQSSHGYASSSHLASTALGSARMAPGAYRTRPVGAGSTRLRGHRLGAGLTTVPHTPVADPLQAVMANPELAESKRYCPSCGQPVGRSRHGTPGRIAGYCGHCGVGFNFAPALTAGDLVGNQYEVVGCLTHGGLGWIYLARDRNVSGRWVVLKGLLNSGDQEANEAAVVERQFLAEVEHPLIVEIFNFVHHHGLGYTVMEFVGGTSLKDLLTQRRELDNGHPHPLPVDQAIAYILEVLPAFSYLHDRDLLYCDFKPDNIIAQGDGVKLIDMGGVRRTDDHQSPIYGTAGYQAPEVATIGPSVASDIFTLGRTLVSLVLDFHSNTTVYQSSFPPVAETPVFRKYDSFYRWVIKACAPAPADRFASVDEARVQLLGVLREVVATDKETGYTATTSAESVLFDVPPLDGVKAPLAWYELPHLKVDPTDPNASWLAGVNVAHPRNRMVALSGAAEATVEVRLALARAAIEAGDMAHLSTTVAHILEEDPWEWRAAWLEGLGHLSVGDHTAARASFNAVYGQVPGEPAPKLALATACEISGEPDVAEQLYRTIVRSDANYTGSAAFGLARVRTASGDLNGALSAFDLVGPTRGSFPDARLQRARLLIAARRHLSELSDALTGIDTTHIPQLPQAQITVGALTGALDLVLRHGPNPHIRIADAPAEEPELRDRLERALRDLAHLTDDRGERISLVDQANRVRRWTLR